MNANTNLRRPQPLHRISPIKWQGILAPGYDWIVDGCFLRGTVAMLSGDGGLGKSLLIQQLATAAAIGRPWLGLETKPCKSLVLFCEDDEAELHRRQDRISAHYDVEHGDLEDVEYISRVGQESILATFSRQGEQMQSTALYAQIEEAAKDLGAQIIALDTVADVFAGDEIRRTQVRRFVTLLRRLAISVQGVVILTAHPSLTGINTGTGLSGSTAWNNSVRSRLYLTGPKRNDRDEETPESRNERWLKTMKNNQAATGDRIPLRWANGVFVRTDTSEGNDMVARLSLEANLLEALRGMVGDGANAAADLNAKTSFVARAKKLQKFKPYSFAVIAAAVGRMREDGRIVTIEMGPPSKRRVYLRTPDTLYPGEVKS